MCLWMTLWIRCCSSRGQVCHSRLVRWADLFDDLDAQLAAQEALDREESAAEISLAESARLHLLERVGCGDLVRVALASGAVVEGAVIDAGSGWVVVDGTPRDVLVSARGIEWLEGARRADPGRDLVARRVGLGHVLRGLAEREVDVVVGTRTADIIGVVLRAGVDHVDIAGERGRVTSVPWDAVVSVLLS